MPSNNWETTVGIYQVGNTNLYIFFDTGPKQSISILLVLLPECGKKIYKYKKSLLIKYINFGKKLPSHRQPPLSIFHPPRSSHIPPHAILPSQLWLSHFPVSLMFFHLCSLCQFAYIHPYQVACPSYVMVYKRRKYGPFYAGMKRFQFDKCTRLMIS